jgi:hypothetical protein
MILQPDKRPPIALIYYTPQPAFPQALLMKFATVFE